jgi:hypothetical protein
VVVHIPPLLQLLENPLDADWPGGRVAAFGAKEAGSKNLQGCGMVGHPSSFVYLVSWLVRGCGRCLREGLEWKLQRRRTAFASTASEQHGRRRFWICLANLELSRIQIPLRHLLDVLLVGSRGLSGGTALWMDACFQAELPSCSNPCKLPVFQDFGRSAASNTFLQTSFLLRNVILNLSNPNPHGAHDQLQSVASARAQSDSGPLGSGQIRSGAQIVGMHLTEVS